MPSACKSYFSSQRQYEKFTYPFVCLSLQSGMLQRKRRNSIGWRSTRVHMTCPAFPLWLERQSSSLLSFVKFIFQFSSVICAFSTDNIFINLLYNFSHEPAKQSEKAGWWLCSRLWAWNGLPLNTYISMHARKNRCYNKRGSRTNYVRSSTPHCTRKHADSESSYILQLQ
jgi:hypothetical protein